MEKSTVDVLSSLSTSVLIDLFLARNLNWRSSWDE